MSFKLTDFITVTNTGITTFESDGVFIDRTGADAYLFFRNSGTNRGSIYGGDPSGNAGLRFYIANNSDPSIVLTSVGNVGIGTTSPTNLSSQTSLTIQGASVSRLDLLGASGAGGGVVFGTATVFTVQGNYGVPLVLDAGTTADMNFNIGGSTKLTISSGGDATFSGKLSVSKSSTDFIAEFQNTNGTNPYGLRIKDAPSPANNYPLFSVSNSGGTTEYFRVNSGTGLTQINSTNTTALELITNQSASSLRLKNTGSIVADWIIQSGGITAGDLSFYNLDTSAYRLTITSGGNVGIGTTLPAELLEVKASSSPAIQINQNDQYKSIIRLGGNDLEIRGSSGTMEFYNGSADGDSSALRMSISSTGTAAFSSPNTTANVAMVTIRSTDSQGADVGGTIGLGGSYGAGLVNYALIRGAKETSTNNDSNGYMSFTVHSSAGEVERMRIASGGIVGIGVVPKTDPFGVGGNQFQMLQFGGVGCIGSYDNAGEAMFSNNVYVSSTVGTFAPITTGNGSAIFCYTDRIDFKSASNQGNGTMALPRRVSIADGTTSGHSSGALELYGAITTLDNGSDAFVNHYLDTGNNYYISTGFKNTSQDIVITNSSAGVRLEYADTSWVSNSDENIKENIVSLDNVLDKIKNIRCVNYNLKDEEIYKKRLGFIAQDFQEDFEEVVGKSSDGILGLRYTETIPILMKAIQEQQAQIEELKSEIQLLKNN